MTVRLLYVTTPNKKEAMRIGRILVEERIAACINVIDSMTSCYRWEGKFVEETEAILWIKTTQGQVDAVIQRVKTLHPYSCPCILVLPIEKGHPEFLKWIEGEVKPVVPTSP